MNEITDKHGILFIISAPSGAGKTTLVQSLAARNPELLVSISHTTRPRRPGETNGVAYHYVSETVFDKMVKNNEFLEHARVFDYQYGTSRKWVEGKLEAGNDVVLEIDWQGAQQVRQAVKKTVSIFILPHTFNTLKQRLDTRGDDNATVKRRMEDATQELSHYSEFDFLVINEEFDVALAQLEAIIQAMRHQYLQQNSYFDDFISRLMEQAANIK